MFTIKGPTRIARLLPGQAQAQALLGPITNVDLTATPDDRRVDLAGNISSDAFRLNTNGIIDLATNGFDGFKASFVLLKPSVLAENLRGGGSARNTDAERGLRHAGGGLHGQRKPDRDERHGAAEPDRFG